MHLVGCVADLATHYEISLRSFVARGRHKRGEHIFVRGDVVIHRTWFDYAWPFDHGRDAVAAFPIGVFFTSEHGGATIGPGKGLGAVVGRIHDDGVFV